MGAVTGMLGLGGGQSGSGVSGPASANLMTTVDPGQLSAAWRGYQSATTAQEALLNAMKNQNGIGNQSQVYGQLQGVANGTGPNPAQAQYQQNVQDIAKQQSGAIGSVQGISPALAARMISQQGSSAMQNAAAAGAVNMGNQQLNAMNAAGNMANVQAGNQMNQTNSNANMALNEQQTLMGAAGQMNNSLVSNQSNINSSNASMYGNVMGNQGSAMGGLGQGIGLVTGISKMKAEGGEIAPPSGPRSHLSRALLSGQFANGAKVAALVSPGEGWIPPGKVNEIARGKSPLQVMDRIPGKPKVPGNSYANDTVAKNLDVGGIVIPNSVMQSKDPAKGAKDFIANIIAKRQARGR